jgi:DNA-binding winged helix-turn-helix (wHTH) protein/tetratricopeptide (TPR) repeat protein
MDYVFADSVLDTRRRELRRNGRTVAIEPQIFDLIHHLLENRDRVVSKDELIEEIWQRRIVSESTLDSRISTARKMIGDDGKRQHLIKTFPRKGIRFIGWVQEEEKSTQVGEPPSTTVALLRKPSVAVLDFKNLTGKREYDLIGDGMAEDIVTELARFSDLAVSPRKLPREGNRRDYLRERRSDASLEYIVEGSLRRGDKGLVVGIRLIEVMTGVQLWGERFERADGDSSTHQIELARNIATILVSYVMNNQFARSFMRPTERLHANDYYIRALEKLRAYWLRPTVGTLHEVRQFLERSIQIDEDFAPSYAILAETFVESWQQPLDDDFLNPATLDRASHFASQAVERGHQLPLVHAVSATVCAYRREHDDALAAVEMANRVNPNYTDCRFALALLICGQHSLAIEAGRRHVQADPFHLPRASMWLGVAHFMARDYAGAASCFRDRMRAPNTRASHMWAAANFAHLGQYEKARQQIKLARNFDPGFSVDLQGRLASICKNAIDIKHHLDGLRKAGLPSR